MSGILNIAYPIFGTIDGWLGLLLPTWLRLALWGAASGAIAMALYAATSSQHRLQALKARSAELRAEVARAEDAGEAARLAMQNVKLSFRFLGAVLGPALLSGIPVLFVLAWVSAAYSLAMPGPGQTVPVAVEPANVALTVTPAAEGQALAVAWPGDNGRIGIAEGQGREIDVAAKDLSLGMIHKRRWWNRLLGNDAGYVPDAWTTDSIRFALPERAVLPFGPSWMRGWTFTYFVSLVLVSLAMKFGFRIV